MSAFSPNSVGSPDNAWKRSEPQQGAHNGDTNARPSIASLGAASTDRHNSSHVGYLEQIRLAALQPPPEQSLVHSRRPQGQQTASSQRSAPSPPAAAQVPHWSALYRDGPNAHSMSLRIPADQANTPMPFAQAVDIVHDPSRPPKDIAVRIHLPLLRDFQEELEEFCRLRRFGLFQQAEEYFNGNLDRVSDTPYVMIQHAEALLAAGDFKGVSRVINQQPFEFDRLVENKEAKKLAINLELLGLLSQPKFPQLAPRALSAAVDGLPGKLDLLRMGSTEVRCICHILLVDSV